MAKPRLPSDPSQTWEVGFLFEQARPVRCVDVRNGMVIAGGDQLYLLRPGQEHIRYRDIPLDIGEVHLAAVEQRGERRYAFASQDMVALFVRRNNEDQILRIRPNPRGPVARHLVWAGTAGPCALYVLWDDGTLARLKADLSDMETLKLPAMGALAADDTGIVAMVSFAPEPRVFVSDDGEQLEFRPLPIAPPEEPAQVFLAVAGTAVAVSFGGEAPMLSRGLDDPFVPCEALAGAGPLAFEGSSPEAALFGAVSSGAEGWIARVERSGAAMCTAEFGTDGGGPPVEIASLAWDASRHKLWAASPQAGILTSVAPVAKKGKKLLS